MTIWLQKRLMVWMGVSLTGSALLWNSGVLPAQSQGAQKETPAAQVAQEFFTFALSAEAVVFKKDWAQPTTGIVFSILELVSTQSRHQLGLQGSRKLLGAIHGEMVKREPRFVSKTNHLESHKAQVKVYIQSPSIDVAMVKEEGEWKVDLIATYGQVAHIQGQALAEAVHKITGVVPSARPLAFHRKQEICANHLQELGRALRMYVEDYDAKLPPLRRWREATLPYVVALKGPGDSSLYHCPAVPQDQRNSYALNVNAAKAGPGLYGSRQHAGTVVLYETSLPQPNAFGGGENAAFRHEGGANYLFADGHVKWLARPQKPGFSVKPAGHHGKQGAKP